VLAGFRYKYKYLMTYEIDDQTKLYYKKNAEIIFSTYDSAECVISKYFDVSFPERKRYWILVQVQVGT